MDPAHADYLTVVWFCCEASTDGVAWEDLVTLFSAAISEERARRDQFSEGVA